MWDDIAAFILDGRKPEAAGNSDFATRQTLSAVFAGWIAAPLLLTLLLIAVAIFVLLAGPVVNASDPLLTLEIDPLKQAADAWRAAWSWLHKNRVTSFALLVGYLGVLSFLFRRY